MRIWKYMLETTDVQEVELPRGARILTVQTQREVPCIWALVNPTNPTVKVKFFIFGTGHEVRIDERARYIGTYQLHGGMLVFHVFSLPE